MNSPGTGSVAGRSGRRGRSARRITAVASLSLAGAVPLLIASGGAAASAGAGHKAPAGGRSGSAARPRNPAAALERLIEQGRLGVPHAGATSFPRASWVVATDGQIFFSSPTIAYIDGVQAVVVGTHAGYVYVANARTGVELPGWPQQVHIVPGVATAVDSSPTVADLDGANKPPSIIVGAGSLSVPDQQGGVEAFYYNGAKRFVFHTKASYNEWGTGPNIYSDSVFSSPAVGDITGSGQLDVVFGSYDRYIYALDPSGQLVPGFPFDNKDSVWSSPALYDSSGSGRDDIFIGADATGAGGCFGGFLYDLRYYDDAPHVIWSRCEPQTFWSSPAVGQIGTDHKLAVVIGTSFDAPYDTPTTTDRIYAFYASDGATIPGWPVSTNGPTFGSPAIGDILGNGQNQVVATSCAHCNNGPAEVDAWTGTAQHIWTAVLGHFEILGSPILVGLSGATADDVAVGNYLGLYLLNGRNGAFLYGTATAPLDPKCAVDNSPAVTDIPGVGWRLIEACGGPFHAGTIVAYPLPLVPSVPPAWPQWRGDSEHLGTAGDPSPPAHVDCQVPARADGYRFVAADGGVFAYGGQTYCGSLGGNVLAAPIVGVAATPDAGGYWEVTADGAVYAFGDARLYPGEDGLPAYGSVQGLVLGGPIVGIAATTNGGGYWLVGADGSVYPFGDAPFYGSMAGKGLKDPIVGMAADPETNGYWLVASDGGIFAYRAPFYGSTGAIDLHKPIVGMAFSPATGGYWLVASDGGIFAYHAPFYGSMAAKPLTKPIVGVAASPLTKGYWLVGGDGGIFAFGAKYYGSTGGIRLDQPIVAMIAGGTASS